MTDLFKLNQANAEGWTLGVVDNVVSIRSTDPNKTDTNVRGHVFSQIMAGSPYHIRAFNIVTTADVDAIALIPKVNVGDWVKTTEAIVADADVMVRQPNPDFNPHEGNTDDYIDVPETEQRTIPAGTVAKISNVEDNRIELTIGDAYASFGVLSDQWFPFKKLNILSTMGAKGLLTVDKDTGVVLHYDPAEGEDPDYDDIRIVDVFELKRTLGDLPDYIDFELVGYTTRDGTRKQPDRDAWLKARLEDDTAIDPTLAAFIRARCGFTS